MIGSETPSIESPRRKRMWVLWLLFFFQFAAVGVYFTYLNIYFRQAGLSGTQIGLLNMTTALVGVASVSGWGYLSDLTGKNRLLIAIGAAGALVAAQFIPLVHTFAGFLVLGCLGSLMGSAPMTLVDSTTLALLGEKREDYGRFRLGGSIGYVLTALTAGFVFDRTGLQLIFPAYGVIMTMFVVVALLLPDATAQPRERSKAEIGQLVRRPVWIIFTISVFLAWIANYATIMFLGVTLQTMGASKSLIGVAITIGAIVEAPLMVYSGPLLRRFGPVRLLLTGFLLMAIRNFLLGWMPSPGWAVAINLLNGPAYVFYWNSAVTYLNKMATTSTTGTAQGLFNSTISLAGVVSSLLTGYLFDLLGPNGLYTVMAFCCLAALVLFRVGTWVTGQTRRIEAEKAA